MTDPTREASPVDADTINLALDAWFAGDCSRPHYDEHIDQMRAAASVIVAALSARAQGEAMRLRAEAAEADARRYRWLRDQHASDGPSYHVRRMSNCPAPKDLDSEIDAAIASGGEG